MAWASVAVAGVSAGISGYKAIKADQADKSAAKEGASLKRPFYQIPGEYTENRNIAAERATQGLSADEKTYAGEQRERGLASSLSTLGETGGGPNDFSQLNQVFADSLKSQSALDAQLHMKNIEFFTNANKDLAGQKATAFGVNELQPYESKLQEIQGRRTAAQTNRNNAIDETIGSLSAVGTGINSRNPFKGTPPSGGSSLGAYSRRFGLEDTGGTSGSPAAGFPNVGTNAPDILNVPDPANNAGNFPNFDQDQWDRMKQDGWDEGANVSMWNQ